MSNNLEYTLSLRNAFSGQINQAMGGLGQFKRSLSSIDGSKINGLRQSFTGLTSAMASAAKISIGAALAGTAATAAAAFKVMHKAADFETLDTGFQVLIGDAIKTKQVISDLQKVEKLTPFDMEQVMASGRTLLAFKESTDQVGTTLTRLADIGSAVNAPLNEMAELYGKARVNQVLFTDDLNQLTGRGVNVIAEFAKILEVPEENIRGMAEQGKLTFPLLEQAFINLTSKGGQFFEMSKKQSETASGMMSSLGSVMQQVMVAIGAPLNEHFLKPLMRDAISLGPRLISGTKAAMGILMTIVQNGKLGEALSLGLKFGLAKAIGFGAEMLGDLANLMAAMFNANIGNMGENVSKFSLMIEGMGDIIRSVLGGAFNRVVAVFQGGIVFAFDQAMEKLGKIPVLGEQLGLSGHKAQSWQESSQQMYDQNGGDMSALKEQGQAKIDQAFNVDGIKGQLEGLGKGLNLGGLMKQFEDAYKGAAKKGTEAGLQEGANNAAPGLASAIAKANEQGTSSSPQSRQSGQSGQSESRYDEDGRRRSDGRKRIISARDGSTVAKRSARSMTDQPGISDQLLAMRQASRLTKEGFSGLGVGSTMNGFKPGDNLVADAATPEGLKGRLMDGSTKAKQTRGLDSLYGGDRPLKRPGSPNFTPPNPKLTPPGVAKAQSQERREAAATAQRGSVEKSRWDAVVAIEKKLASLGLAS